jgi:hypothetical protein
MKLEALLFRNWVWLLVLSGVFALSGCAPKEMYQVKGKVTYKDGSVPKGILAIVNFTPAPNSSATIPKGATGAIESDGSFEMVTRRSGDGVHHGEYSVTFRVLRDANGTSLVSPKYGSLNPPPFTVKVDRDISDLNYEIEKAEGVTAAPNSPAPAGPGSAPGT